MTVDLPISSQRRQGGDQGRFCFGNQNKKQKSFFISSLLLSVAVSGRKGFALLTLPDHSPLREFEQGRNKRQEFKQRPLLSALLPIACSAGLFYITQNHLPRGAIAHSDLGVLLHQSLVKKMLPQAPRPN